MGRAELTRQEQDRRDRLAAERRLVSTVDATADRMRKLELANGTLHRKMADWRDQAEKLSIEVEDLRRAQDDQARDATKRRADRQLEEATLWSALQTIRDGFALFDAQHRLVAANKAYVAIFDGLEDVRPGVSIRAMFDLLHAEGIVDPGTRGRDWPAYMAERWTQDRIPSERLHLWNGQIVNLVDTRLPCGGIVSRGINLTDTLRIQAAFEALPDGFVIYDSDDRLVMCNETYRHLYNASSEAMQPGTPFIDILRHGLRNGQYREAVGREEAWLEDRMERHQRLTGEPMEQPMDDGRWVRVLEVATPDGGRAGFRFDITAQKEQELELRRMNAAAQAAERAKSAFLANMGHEIRTPMNGLVGTADLLLDTALDDAQSELAQTLRRSAEALLTFMDDVLDFSRAEANQIVLSPAPFCPRGIVEETVSSFSAQARMKGLTLTADSAEDLTDAYVGDARRIRQILANLVGNALKFTDAGSVTLRAARGAGASLVLSVSDTGPGVPSDRVATIFEGFAQADDGATRAHDGCGLGLAICRKLAERMGGTLEYRDRPGGGATFACLLPLEGATQQASAASDTGADCDDPARVLRIVAADDNATNRMILGKLLKPLGVDLRMVSDGQACIDAVCADPPDLVLMDISMPDMDGCEATRRIRAWEAGKGRARLPVVAMTAHVLPEEADRFLQAGLDRVLTKPLKRDALAAELDGLRAGGMAPSR